MRFWKYFLLFVVLLFLRLELVPPSIEEALRNVKIDASFTQRGFNHTVVIVAQYQNEGQYLLEWIAHHLLLGVDHFYLYDHLSTDDHLQLLKPLEKQGLVTLVKAGEFYRGGWRERRVLLGNLILAQRLSFLHWYHVYRREAKWLLCIDVDEFIHMPSGNLKTFVGDMSGSVGGIALARIPFSTDGRIQKLRRNELALVEFGERVRERELSREAGKIMYRTANLDVMFVQLHAFHGTGVLVDALGRRCENRNESHWAGFNVERVEQPVVLVHFLTRSLQSCWEKQRQSKKYDGGWRHHVPQDYCERWHRGKKGWREERYERMELGQNIGEVCEKMWQIATDYCRRWKCCKKYEREGETREDIF